MPEHTDNYEHLADAPIADLSSMLQGEDLGEWQALQSDPQAQTTDANKPGTSTTDNQESTQPALELDGEQIPLEQAREWLSKGRDATRKWQEAADLKRQAEAQLQRVQWVDELERAWQAGPEGQRAVIDSLQRMAGFQTPQGPQLNPDDLSDEGRILAQQNAQLRQEITHVRQEMAKALESFERYVGDQRITDEAAQTAARLKSEWGVDVQPHQLREAAKRQGIQDLEAAWLKENKALLRQPAAEPKPKSPVGRDKTFDPNASGMSADRMFRLLVQGYEPST